MSARKADIKKLRTRHLTEMAVFAMLGAVMFISKIVMELLPNIHLLGMLTITFTLVYRVRALIPIYIYVMLNGIYAGFEVWWVPYLYLWAVLWGMTMLLPRRMTKAVGGVVCPLLCGLHGLAFGILYAPAQALFFGLDQQEMLAWIIAGIPFDVTHAIGNAVAGCLCLPLSALLQKLSREIGMKAADPFAAKSKKSTALTFF